MFGDVFIDKTKNMIYERKKFDKSDFIKIINSYVKDTFKRKKNATDWKKIFSKHMSLKDVYPKYKKDF